MHFQANFDADFCSGSENLSVPNREGICLACNIIRFIDGINQTIAVFPVYPMILWTNALIAEKRIPVVATMTTVAVKRRASLRRLCEFVRIRNNAFNSI